MARRFPQAPNAGLIDADRNHLLRFAFVPACGLRFEPIRPTFPDHDRIRISSIIRASPRSFSIAAARQLDEAVFPGHRVGRKS